MVDDPPGERYVKIPRSGRDIILSWIKKGIAALVVLAAVSYLLDYLVLRIRIATNATPFGTVTVHPVLAIPQKNRSTEFMVQDPQDQACVHSLFPHAGDLPCWYLARHREQQINM
ncbi:MAG TPA: hypothetical protein VHZ55_13635 [Bryobacteraceae bacterium]|jgi:hypothetical protein|nr:hypothetical protein [Bryobacteraceae bacterium]